MTLLEIANARPCEDDDPAYIGHVEHFNGDGTVTWYELTADGCLVDVSMESALEIASRAIDIEPLAVTDTELDE